MKTSNIFKLAGVALVAGSLSAYAADSGAAGPVYLHADAGVAFLQSLEGRDGTGGSADFDVGVRADVALGYHINDCWAAEFETGVIWNEADNNNGTLYQIPFLLNAVYNLHMEGKFLPYFGAGAGGVASILDVEDVGSDTDFTFGFQAFAGVKYALSETMAIDIAYKFFGSLEHSWTISGTTARTEGAYTHSGVLSFTWLF